MCVCVEREREEIQNKMGGGIIGEDVGGVCKIK